MRLFMFMIFILIQIKFGIDINDDELYRKPYENIRREEKIKLIISSSAQPKFN
jgi:hypothetical protein